MNGRFLASAFIIAILVAAGAGYFVGVNNQRTTTSVSTQTRTIIVVKQSSIMLQGFSLCSSDCNYPSPYLSGIILFNGTAAVRSLRLIVNGTDEGVEPWSGINLTTFALGYKGGFQNPPVVKGDVYVIRFVATFQDDSTATAVTTVVAD